jgi:hypothetical protein
LKDDIAASERPKQKTTRQVIGVISDTHGLIRPQALLALRGVDRIIHAGDIGAPEIIEALDRIAPTVAIKGNNDRDRWAKAFPETELIEQADTKIYVIHNVKELRFQPAERGIRVVISGHSHKPSVDERDGVLYLNPGSAGPRRFKLPIAVAKLRLSSKKVTAQLIELAT